MNVAPVEQVSEWTSLNGSRKRINLRQESKFPKKKKLSRTSRAISENLGILNIGKIVQSSTESSGESSDYFDCLLKASASVVLHKSLSCHSNFVVNVWEFRSLDKKHHRVESGNF